MAANCSGVLVIGHGMREAPGSAAFMEIVNDVRLMLPNMPVEGAFMEFAQPTIADSITRLVAQGATYIAAVPMFLSALGHTANDIPKALAEAVGAYCDGSGFRVQGSGIFKGHEKINISLKSHVGSHQRVVELSALRYQQALEGREDIPHEETLLIIAAHGSPEPEAILELSEFATRRVTLTPVGQVEPCFAVLGKPQLTDVLGQTFAVPYNRIVIQPHLLLRGRFYDSICNLVKTYRRKNPHIDWITTEPLGPDRLLAQAVSEIVNEC
jgi:sirohydrochlorin cobaltochelatase